MNDFYEWFRILYNNTGINLTIFYDDFDRSRFISGFLTTIQLSVVCLISSVAIGIVGAWLQGSSLVWTRRIVQGYIQVFRNTPPLVQMYFFFFGLAVLLPTAESEYGIPQPMLSSFTWATISLSFFAGAFNFPVGH